MRYFLNPRPTSFQKHEAFHELTFISTVFYGKVLHTTYTQFKKGYSSIQFPETANEQKIIKSWDNGELVIDITFMKSKIGRYAAKTAVGLMYSLPVLFLGISFGHVTNLVIPDVKNLIYVIAILLQ